MDCPSINNRFQKHRIVYDSTYSPAIAQVMLTIVQPDHQNSTLNSSSIYHSWNLTVATSYSNDFYFPFAYYLYCLYHCLYYLCQAYCLNSYSDSFAVRQTFDLFYYSRYSNRPLTTIAAITSLYSTLLTSMVGRALSLSSTMVLTVDRVDAVFVINSNWFQLNYSVVIDYLLTFVVW